MDDIVRFIKNTQKVFTDPDVYYKEPTYFMSRTQWAYTLRILQDRVYYQWHDLLFDPNDIPSKEGHYLAEISDSNGHTYYDVVTFYKDVKFGDDSVRNTFAYSYNGSIKFYEDGDVIAWKFIEPCKRRTKENKEGGSNG